MQQAIIMATVWVDDDKIKSDYNIKKKTWNYVCVVKPNEWRRENQEQHKAPETRHLTSECARSLLVRSCCRHTHSLHTTSRGSSCPRVCTHLIHAWSERHSSTLSSPCHPTFSSIHSSKISCSPSCTPSTNLKAVLTLPTSPKRRWCLRTNPTPTQVMIPKTTSGRLMSSPSQATVPRKTVPRGCGLRWHRARRDAL